VASADTVPGQPAAAAAGASGEVLNGQVGRIFCNEVHTQN
jgi:hypothetical protein